MVSFAAYIPVGPASTELERVVDLVDSLCFYEPTVSLIIVVDNGLESRDFHKLLRVPQACRVLSIKHCKQDHTVNRSGVMCASGLAALEAASTLAKCDFLLKCDTDSLIIRPFSEQISRRFQSRSDCGMVGVLGNSCNRDVCESRDRDALAEVRWALTVATRLKSNPNAIENRDLIKWSLFYNFQRIAFLQVCKELEMAIHKGYDGKHCQGGSYAVSAEMIGRMEKHGFFADRDRWLNIPLAEDRVMGAYCHAVGLTVENFSEIGEPFGIQDIGLPFPLLELVNRQHSIIHSVRNCAEPESTIRDFFRARRVPNSI